MPSNTEARQLGVRKFVMCSEVCANALQMARIYCFRFHAVPQCALGVRGDGCGGVGEGQEGAMKRGGVTPYLGFHRILIAKIVRVCVCVCMVFLYIYTSFMP